MMVNAFSLGDNKWQRNQIEHAEENSVKLKRVLSIVTGLSQKLWLEIQKRYQLTK